MKNIFRAGYFGKKTFIFSIFAHPLRSLNFLAVKETADIFAFLVNLLALIFVLR